ncbi:phosphoinositide binding protein ATG18 [Kluyveromyces lactis]|uniref:Autophagy-related protein 18 n=1 Tax=Kluyveromyces lactis (strain ATCC 8585 / CBS 2359 / DSM 70799 / NBRC 1267 / NRRL Y-1140 / WM37) TaxID=284590 RepID=ATG18_KLULA|nr:uncharacterized protein KLLA0_D04664g [Kluyveromyces lactis]Q6CS21.1 RecName: Full=Autophagy-related protein 18 [Kluyveromyces lactis NRRL Y-1140]CAH00364.1 KLLA0D04664p [Kluyveromyces lactis]|eukprot:XP_453268.1 uncharacterized protein KLLA0_D04664g [Kluyveromyces lactis]
MSNLPIINFINFNQNGSCISMGTSQGFKIFNCEPFGRFYQDEEGGCGIVEMLFSTSLLAVVGMGDNPAMSPRRLRMLNTKRHSVICEVTFPTTILSVKMNKSRLAVLLQEQIYIYDISNMRLLHTIETSMNAQGIMSMSPNSENNYLVYPSPPKVINSEIKDHATTNNINIKKTDAVDDTIKKDYSLQVPSDITGQQQQQQPGVDPATSNNTANKIIKNGDVIVFNLQTLQPTMVIEAHKGEIAALKLSADGTLLATASEKGTIIRVFNVENGSKVYQFRRGTYPTKISSLSFSKDNQFLAVCSSSKTVHIFKLGKNTVDNKSNELNSDDEIEDDLVPRYGDEDEEDEEIDEEATSINSNHSSKEPVVDAKRSTVGRMIRKSSQRLSRKAARTLGAYFPIKVSSILEPSRHFASLKITTSSNQPIKAIAAIDDPIELSIKEYPDLFEKNASNNGDYQNSDTLTMVPIRVVSSEGFMYKYISDPERGGDCILLEQYSLLSD